MTRLSSLWILAFVVVQQACTTVGDRGPAPAAHARVETVEIPTVTLDTATFLRGRAEGRAGVISAELEFPSGASPVPAVVLLHGGSGVLPYQHVWARELRATGAATLVVDSFTGRGLRRIADDLEALNASSRVVDLYGALKRLAVHPRVDRDRIVFMGFSHGATAGLFATSRRFRTAFGPPDVDYAAWVLFYPYCNTRFIDELPLTSRPIRLFHGTADDWTPIEPCRAFVTRARASRADIQLVEYPLAYHGFDNPRGAPHVRIESAMNPSRCFFVEAPGAVVLNPETGKPFTYRDPCWSRGVTAGYQPTAYADALGQVKALVGALARR